MGTEHEPATPIPANELAAVFGADSAGARAEMLTHNPRNAVTGGIWRVRCGSRSAVVKLLRHRPEHEHLGWESSDRATHWNYWKREALVYGSEPGEPGPLDALLEGTGLARPRLLARFARSDHAVALWLEDVDGRRGDLWRFDDHRAAAHALGRFHARGLSFDRAATPWLSRDFIHDYPRSKPVDWSLLDDETIWRETLVAKVLGSRVQRAGQLLRERTTAMTRLLQQLPRTVSHLDFWPMNAIRRSTDSTIVVFDWSFAGDGALGEDLGNHVPDTGLDLFVPADQLTALDATTFPAYLAGLRAEQWQGDERLARLGVCASAVKYAWLLPLLLERVQSGVHWSYGGGAVSDVEEQYRQRGLCFVFLADWVLEAEGLAGELGL